jgi:Holliday junction resolvasome RuvABC ATP-dependent DNA helicase subunit
MLARALATALGTGCVETRGQLSREELVPKFLKIGRNDIVFIDESHLLKNNAVDLLLEVIDEFKITRLATKEANKADEAKESNMADRIEIAPCTVILATDQPGALANALYKRMKIQVPLRLYRVEELKEIAERIATKLDLLISPQAARVLANVAHGLPRIVEHLLEVLRFYHPNSEGRPLRVSDIKEFLRARGIDDQGLGTLHRQYLNHLDAMGSASLQSLALHLQADCDFVQRQIEPVLSYQRLIKISHGGRELTKKGRARFEPIIEESRKEESKNGNS